MLTILSALLMQAAVPPPVVADTSREQDLRCLVAITAALPAIPEAQRPNVQALAMYYVGRIDARTPRFDYERAMASLLSDTGPDRLRGDMERCGTQMQARGRALSALGDALQARAARETGKGK